MSLLARTNPRPTAPGTVRMIVTLFTRAQCCCCQSAREALREYQDVHGFRLDEVDASDPALIAEIGPTVPVVTIDGKVRFRGEVNRVLFERLLAAGRDG